MAHAWPHIFWTLRRPFRSEMKSTSKLALNSMYLRCTSKHFSFRFEEDSKMSVWFLRRRKQFGWLLGSDGLPSVKWKSLLPKCPGKNSNNRKKTSYVAWGLNRRVNEIKITSPITVQHLKVSDLLYRLLSYSQLASEHSTLSEMKITHRRWIGPKLFGLHSSQVGYISHIFSVFSLLY
jgi:hypothetical protein